MRKAVVLLSGGVDGATCLSLSIKNGYEAYPITFDLNNRPKKAIESAKAISKYYKIKNHRIFKLENFHADCNYDKDFLYPANHANVDTVEAKLPARDLIFLSYALGYAESIEAESIFYGINFKGNEANFDKWNKFLNAFIQVAKVGSILGGEDRLPRIVTPLASLRKGEIITLACETRAPIHLTSSCRKGAEKACGSCVGCMERLKSFKEAGIEDPLQYEIALFK